MLLRTFVSAMRTASVRVQFASDVHLEFEGPGFSAFEDIVRKVDGCDILILNGDIATVPSLDTLRRFLKYCKRSWKNVFLIPGNHEYYYSSYDRANAALESLCVEVGVTWAMEHVHRIPEERVALLMTPLWSDIPVDLENYVAMRMNDYQIVEGLTPSFTSALHATMKNFLMRNTEVLIKEGYKVVVATHHTPLLEGTNAPHHQGSRLNIAFSTDLPEVMNLGVHTWIYGHTHYNSPYLEVKHTSGDGKTVVVSNQRGYNGRMDEESSPYDPMKFIEI